MPTQCRHASIPTHRFQFFGLSWDLNLGLYGAMHAQARVARGLGSTAFPRSCSSTYCSLSFPIHHWLTSTMLWSLVIDREGRESWGKRYILSSLRIIIIKAVACVNVTSFLGHALSCFSICTLCGGSACPSLGEWFWLEREMNSTVGCWAVQTRMGFCGVSMPREVLWEAGNEDRAGELAQSTFKLGCGSGASMHWGHHLTLLVVKESHTITFPSWREKNKLFGCCQQVHFHCNHCCSPHWGCGEWLQCHLFVIQTGQR